MTEGIASRGLAMTEGGRAITHVTARSRRRRSSLSRCPAEIALRGLAMTGAAHRNVAFPVTARAQSDRGSQFSRDCFGHWSLAMTDGRSLPATLRSRLKAFLFDLKAAPGDYRRRTGIDYDTPAANLRIVKSTGCAFWLRLPLVPGVNDTEAYFANVAVLVAECHPARVELVPYHALGVDKRLRFGLPDAAMPSIHSTDDDQVACWTAHLRELGVEAKVPGED